ncbi:MAG TPA: copper chaperone PCu(A)C [Noviherbaspirillum sp.]
MTFRPLILTALLLAASTSAIAQNVHVTSSFARSTMPQQKSAGAYLTLENRGKEADRLIAASTPAAKSVELHTMAMEGNVMRMREVEGIELKPGAKLEMKPGSGYHLMLMGLQQPLTAGAHLDITLQFEKAGKVAVTVPVQAATGAHGMHGDQGGHAGAHGAPARH